jgi:hypothetical protein
MRHPVIGIRNSKPRVAPSIAQMVAAEAARTGKRKRKGEAPRGAQKRQGHREIIGPARRRLCPEISQIRRNCCLSIAAPAPGEEGKSHIWLFRYVKKDRASCGHKAPMLCKTRCVHGSRSRIDLVIASPAG